MSSVPSSWSASWRVCSSHPARVAGGGVVAHEDPVQFLVVRVMGDGGPKQLQRSLPIVGVGGQFDVWSPRRGARPGR
jgi:hypothetical protein